MGDKARFTIIQQGDGNAAYQVNGPMARGQDLVADQEAMIKFIDAAAGALAALDLSAEAREDAVRTVEALHAEESGEGSASEERREVAASLWRIVEGAAGSALGAALLDIWHP